MSVRDDVAPPSAAAGRALSLIVRPLGDGYGDDGLLDELGARFRSDGYVGLPGLLASETRELLREEIARLEPQARARDFVMAGPQTPRVLSVLGAKDLLAGSPALAALYAHFKLVRAISRIAGERVHACPHEDELMVCNFLLGDRSTHGWHLDDPPYALVLVLEAPEPGCGGELQHIADWAGVCGRLGLDPHGDVRAAVDAASAAGLLSVTPHGAGDAYLLRADRCLHRVSPLRAAGGRRVAVNFAYERTSQPSYGESATALYGR